MGAVTMSDTAAAYAWTKEQPAPLPQIEPVGPGEEHGLDAMVDDVVKGVLDATGVLDKLELVTGMPQQLTVAAEEWHTEAKSLQSLANVLRMGAAELPGCWEGTASERFGHTMGDVVAAIDGTVEDMGRAAAILSNAAKECKLAEDTVIGLIRELIELLVTELIGGIVLDIVTLGLGAIVDALVADATVDLYVVRITREVEGLGRALERLVKSIREVRSAEKKIEKIKEARKAAKSVRKLGGLLGKRELGGQGVTREIVWGAMHEAESQFKEHLIAPLTGEPEPAGPIKDAVTHGTAQQTMPRDVASPRPRPYRVNKTRIEEDFG